jgi:hypothetical protein
MRPIDGLVFVGLKSPYFSGFIRIRGSARTRRHPVLTAGVFMDDPEQGGNRHAAVAGLAIAVVLLVVGIWLAHELTAASKLQDCLMSGRTNCAVIPAQ